MGLLRGKILLCGAVMVSIFSTAAVADHASEGQGAANKTKATSPGRHDAANEKNEVEQAKATSPGAQDEADEDDEVEQVATDAGGTGNEEGITDDGGADDEERDTQEEDIFATILKVKVLQPFYLMPVAFGVKLILTFLIFGFDLAFKPPAPRTSLSPLKDFAGACGSIFFICMALNGYYQDFMKVKRAASTFWDVASIGFVVILTSPNYVAARAIWGSLQIQSPAKTLSLKPKFVPLPTFGIPLVPGGAKYLPVLKHIYALLLLPYFFLSFAMGVLVSCAYVGWCCSTRCTAMLYLCKAFCSLCCAFFGIIVTLGLWAWAKTSFGYWWQMDWPYIYYVAVQSWATSVCPVLFTVLYACALRTAPENAFKALCALKEGVMFDEEDVKELRVLNYERLKDDFDFDYEELPTAEDETVLDSKEKLKAARKITEMRQGVIEGPGITSTKEELMAAFKNFDDSGNGYLSCANLRRIMASLPKGEVVEEDECDMMIREADIEGGGLINYEEWIDRSLEWSASVDRPKSTPKPNSLDDAKISIFRHTLQNMSSIIAEQILVLFLVRAIRTSTLESYLDALRVTISERSMASYYGHLQQMASLQYYRMLNMMWNIL